MNRHGKKIFKKGAHEVVLMNGDKYELDRRVTTTTKR